MVFHNFNVYFHVTEILLQVRYIPVFHRTLYICGPTIKRSSETPLSGVTPVPTVEYLGCLQFFTFESNIAIRYL